MTHHGAENPHDTGNNNHRDVDFPIPTLEQEDPHRQSKHTNGETCHNFHFSEIEECSDLCTYHTVSPGWQEIRWGR